MMENTGLGLSQACLRIDSLIVLTGESGSRGQTCMSLSSAWTFIFKANRSVPIVQTAV